MVEHVPEEHSVGGSIPLLGTKRIMFSLFLMILKLINDYVLDFFYILLLASYRILTQGIETNV